MQNINILHHAFVRGNLLCKKLIVQTKEEDKQNDQRKDISDVYAHPFLDLQAFSGVGFFCEVFPAPSGPSIEISNPLDMIFPLLFIHLLFYQILG